MEESKRAATARFGINFDQPQTRMQTIVYCTRELLRACAIAISGRTKEYSRLSLQFQMRATQIIKTFESRVRKIIDGHRSEISAKTTKG